MFNDLICYFKSKIVEEDIFFVDQSTDYFECLFHKKRIIAEKPDSQLFFSTSSNCQFKDPCLLTTIILSLRFKTRKRRMETKRFCSQAKLKSSEWGYTKQPKTYISFLRMTQSQKII